MTTGWAAWVAWAAVRLICCCLIAWMMASGGRAEESGTPPLAVAPGFMVEKVTDLPLVQRPVSLALDEDGALYVTDSSGKSPHGQDVLKDTGNRVLRLVDGRGDGHYTQATVFADGLTFPEGCLWYDGSLYVGGAPNILKLTDS